jgi:hypothetical protein
VTDPTHVVIDINGYYAPPGTLPLTGTAAAPALTFGDTTTGLYSDTAGTVSIATRGVNRLTIDTNGDLELPGSIRKGGTLFVHNIGAPGSPNTAIGVDALGSNSGVGNTATGGNALEMNTSGGANTATGVYALHISATGDYNTALGWAALEHSISGSENTAVGDLALDGVTTGQQNTAMGGRALENMTTGANNTALGFSAGMNVTLGSYNVHIANDGEVADANLIRIGDSNHNRTFIAGIRSVTTGNPDAIPVLIDSNGQLGTASSSRRVKRDIEGMGDTTDTILGLRPVRFRYQAHGAESPIQYGLIAEEVAEIAPDLVARDKDGRFETVYYDKVNAMLLNEVQKLHRENQALESRLAELEGVVRSTMH